MISIPIQTYPQWRDAARDLASRHISPDQILWGEALFGDPYHPQPTNTPLRVSKRFLDLAPTVAMHRDETKWALLYRVLFRLTHGERDLLDIEIDDDVRKLALMDKAVRRDIHKMRAFVRFRQVRDEAGETFIAWYQPDHLIVEANARFFKERFGAMRWAILTPDASISWDLHELRTGPGMPRSSAPTDDQLEDLWRAYYASIFNPGRLNLKVMRQQLPTRFWHALPESQIISELALTANARVTDMAARQPRSALEFMPADRSLDSLRAAVQRCEACELYKCATQAVFGEGPSNARMVLVGEQPGDNEDLAGRAFIGPAGQLLDLALKEAGVHRAQTYITGAVRHFKFVERGKRRIHQTPRASEIAACRPWLEAELESIRPRVVVCMGASAAQSVLGRAVTIKNERGKLHPHASAEFVTVTVHPSSVLRMQDETAKQEQYQMFVEDLRRAREIL